MIKNIFKTGLNSVAADSLVSVATEIKELALKRFTSSFMVKRNESGLVYSLVAKWLIEDGLIKTDKHLSITSYYYSLDDDCKQTTLNLPPEGSYYSRLNNKALKITISSSPETREHAINLICYNDKEGNLVSKIREIVDAELNTDSLKIEEISSGNYIVKPKRDIDGVILSEKNKRELIKHLEWFKGAKPLYKKFGITYKTGILLKGPPGTGKSSLAQAVASYMNLPLCIITTSDLFSKRNELKPRTVILIEDIDRESVSGVDDDNEEDKKEKKDLTLAEVSAQNHVGKLLQILDGALSPEGVIFIMTTNHPDRIDPALIRPGRVDKELMLDYFDMDMALELCKKFDVNPSIIDRLPEDEWRQPARLQLELLKVHMDRQ